MSCKVSKHPHSYINFVYQNIIDIVYFGIQDDAINVAGEAIMQDRVDQSTLIPILRPVT